MEYVVDGVCIWTICLVPMYTFSSTRCIPCLLLVVQLRVSRNVPCAYLNELTSFLSETPNELS